MESARFHHLSPQAAKEVIAVDMSDPAYKRTMAVFKYFLARPEGEYVFGFATTVLTSFIKKDDSR